MKKFVSCLLALVMVLGMCACGASEAPATESPMPAGPSSALEVLENIWALYG